MQYRCLALVLFPALVSGVMSAQVQAAQPGAVAAGSAAPATPTTATQVPLDAAVITIEGLCDGGLPTAKFGAGCKTVITRAQFEKLAEGNQSEVAAAVPPTENMRLATRYPELLVHAQRFRELGLDKDPEFQERLRYNILGTYSTALLRHLRDQAFDLSDAEVQKSYTAHPELFDQMQVMQVFIPNAKQSPPDASLDKPKSDPVSDKAALRALADRIRARAAADEDFDKLEAEAYTAATGSPDHPDVDLGMVPLNRVPAQYREAILSLQVGQVSQLVEAPTGWHVFKLVSREKVALKDAKNVLAGLRFEHARAELEGLSKATLNDEYFHGLAAPAR